MKRKFFTLIFACAIGFAYAQDGSDFGAKDVLICDFEDVTPVVVDSLWADSTKTVAITTSSANISIADNPFPLENTSSKVAKYVRPAGMYKSLYIRFDESIKMHKTPYLQVQVYPVKGKSPAKTTVSISVFNDKDSIIGAGKTVANLSQDEWTTVTAFIGRLKSSDLYNAISITINADDSTSSVDVTEYYIDQIGFKAPEEGVVIPATIFYETFGGWYADWEAGTIEGQYAIPNWDGSGTEGPGQHGKAEVYDTAVGGFTSGLHFTFKDVNADTATCIHISGWSAIQAIYEGASSGAQLEFPDYRPGTLETGDINVTGHTNMIFSFGFGTQFWWAYQDAIGQSRPKVEISVDGGNFYEITTTSEFLLLVGQEDLGWGLLDKYEDLVYKLIEYPLTNKEGLSLDSTVNTVNLRISHKAGSTFWIDDLWLAAEPEEEPVGVQKLRTDAGLFTVYPNPATDFIDTRNAQGVFITDIHGRVVMQSTNADMVNVSSLASGVYLVKVQVDGKIRTGKFIKR